MDRGMNVYTYGWMDGWMNGWKDGREDEWVDGWMGGCTGGCMDGCMHGYVRDVRVYYIAVKFSADCLHLPTPNLSGNGCHAGPRITPVLGTGQTCGGMVGGGGA